MRVLLVSLCLLVSGSAFAAFDVSVVGIGDIATPSADPSFEIGNKFGLGFGANLEVDIAPMWSLEAGLFHVNRKYAAENIALGGLLSPTVSSRYLMIPLLLRWGLLETFTIGAGGYYASALGDLSLSQGSISVDIPYSNLSLSKSDFGLVGSARLKLPLAPTLSILADGRYLLGLSDVNEISSQSFKWRDMQFLLGLAFGI
jgi:hypothetical protein